MHFKDKEESLIVNLLYITIISWNTGTLFIIFVNTCLVKFAQVDCHECYGAFMKINTTNNIDRMANGSDPDQTAQSDLCLHCLLTL